jgi:hypothetical protein
MTKPPAYEQFSAPDATSLLVINDLHENVSMLERSLQAASKTGGKTVVVLSDILNHDSRMQAYQTMGLPNPAEIIPSYIASRLPEQERQIFQLGHALDQYGGLERYIEAVRAQQPSADVNAMKQQFGEAYTFYKSEFFTKTLEKLIADTPDEDKAKLQHLQLQAAASLELVNGYMDDQGLDAIARTLKKYESAIDSVIIGAGNHDNPLHVQGLQARLGKKVYWSENIKGTMKAGDISFQVATNTGGLIPSSEAFVYGENVAHLYGHLLHGGHTNNPADVKKLDAATLKQSPTYHRMQGIDSLDLLISHYDSLQGDKTAFPTPLDVGAYWAMSKLKPEGVVLSGHMHVAREGINVAGYRAVRQPGATLVTKANSQLALTTVAPFTKVDTVYEIAAFKKRLTQELPEYLKQIIRAAQGQRAA